MLFHIAVALSLIALVMGTYLVVRVAKEEVCCKGFAKIVGIATIVLSILVIICSAYHSVGCWKGKCMRPGMGAGGGMGMGMMHHMKGMDQDMKKATEDKETEEGDED